MPFLTDFSTTLFAYARELFFPILIGCFISGIIHEFIPTKIVEKYLGQKGLKPILRAVYLFQPILGMLKDTLILKLNIKMKMAK